MAIIDRLSQVIDNIDQLRSTWAAIKIKDVVVIRFQTILTKLFAAGKFPGNLCFRLYGKSWLET